MQFLKNIFTKTKKLPEKKIPKLISAKEAFEGAKTPQIIKAVETINEAKKSGRFHTYICDQEKPCDELLNIILTKGYDIHVHAMKHISGDPKIDIFTEVFFTEDTSGKITFHDSYTKQLFPTFADNSYDIYEKDSFIS